MATMNLLDDDDDDIAEEDTSPKSQQDWDIEDEYNFSGVAGSRDASTQVAVLIDAHRSMGRPLCEDSVLREAIFKEVCAEAEKSASKSSSWSSFFSGPAEMNKEDIKRSAAVTTAAVLSGERKPPGNLMRSIDAVAQVLERSTPRLGDTALVCSFFGEGFWTDPAGPSTNAAQKRPQVELGRSPPGQLTAVWEMTRGGAGTPSFEVVLAEVMSTAKAVIVFAARPLPVTAVQAALDAHPSGPAPSISWMHCSAQPPPDFPALQELCVCSYGQAALVQTDKALTSAVDALLRSRAASPGSPDPLTPDTLHRAISGAAQGLAGSLLESTGLTTGGLLESTATVSESVVEAGRRALQLVEQAAADASPSAGGYPHAGGASGSAPPVAASQPERSGEARVAEAAVQAVLSRHAEELAALSADERKKRIRELVAREVSSSKPRFVQPQVLVHRFVSGPLDLERDVENRILLEWLLVLNRTFAYCGDIFSLVRGGRVSRLWNQALSLSGSSLSKSLWKWTVRFGEPVPAERRWGFWCWLLARHGGGRRAEPLRAAGPTHVGESAAGAGGALMVPVKSGSEDANDPAQEAPRRVLASAVAQCPAMAAAGGLHQGLEGLAAFVISVAEDACGDAAEAEGRAAGLIAGLLELEEMFSWMGQSLPGIRVAAGALGNLLPKYLPRLADRFSQTGVDVEALTLLWLKTLFVDFEPMPRMTLCRIWECWLLDGSPKVFFRTALVLLAQAEELLLTSPPERMAEVLATYPPPLDDDLVPSRLVPRAWAVKVTRRGLRPALESARAATAVEAAGAVADAARVAEAEAEAAGSGVASARAPEPLKL